MADVIRPFALDYEGVFQLLNRTVDHHPATADELKASHERFPEGGLRDRRVAVSPDGAITGYANIHWAPGQAPGRFSLALVTAPEARNQGLGSALLTAAEDWARAGGGTEIEAHVPDDDEAALAFARNRGYEIHSHEFESSLAVAAFDEAPFTDVIPALETDGIRFFSYADEPGEATQAKLSDLYGASTTGPIGYWSPEFWMPHVFTNPGILPEGILLAAEGDRLVGCTVLVRVAGSDDLLTDFTGVRPEFRGRNLGLALKLLSVRAARRLGAPVMQTRNDSQNLPMLAINRKMGYQKQQGEYWLRKRL